MSSSGTKSTLLLELARAFLEQHRRGERPSIRDYQERFPEMAAALQEILAAMALLENIALDNLTTPSDAQAVLSGEDFPDRTAGSEPFQMGDFRIVREIGRGGMGVVYEAFQQSLGRRVALKLLPRHLLANEQLRARFEREARAVARLHHTNIVSVFGIGQFEGQPFYVMQFIDGQNLDAILAQRRAGPPSNKVVSSPTVYQGPPRQIEKQAPPSTGIAPGPDDALFSPSVANNKLDHSSATIPLLDRISRLTWQDMARWIAQAAEALEHAHGQGVLHRDIKPGNLLIDQEGTLWLTDFGLARMVDQENLTSTGDVLGTLRYMPPEAFEGKASVAGDVYSLGLTLYELLTGRPAYSETDRARLILQVMTASPPRIRTLNPAIPRDLETLVHKSIDREPTHRYSSAGEMAADLHRFIADEPIQARRLSLVEHLVRWATRNRAVAASLAVAGLLLLVLAVGSVLAARYYQDQERIQRGLVADKEIERGNAAEASRRAESRRREMRENLYDAEIHLASQALDTPRGNGRAAELLAHWRPSPGESDLRGWEWYFLHGQCRPSLQTLTGHQLWILGLAWNPDARLVAASGLESNVCVWDAITGKALWTLVTKGPVFDLAWSPDGSRLALCGQSGSIMICEAATGKEVMVLHGLKSTGLALAWSPDATLLASVCMDHHIRIWDAVKGKERIRLSGHTRQVRSLAWSPDGTRLASAAWDSTIKIWDWASSRELATLRTPALQVEAVAWSPDGMRLASGGQDHTIRMWDPLTSKELATWREHTGTITSISWSPDGQRLVSTAVDGTVKVWNVAGGNVQFHLPRHHLHVNKAVWSSDGRRIAVGSMDGIVEIWDAACQESCVVANGNIRVWSVAWSPDGTRLLTGNNDSNLRIWESTTLRNLTTMPANQHILQSVAWSPDGTQLASAGWNYTIKIWDATANKNLALLQGHTRYANSVVWSPDGQYLASGSSDQTIKIWDRLRGKEIHTLRGHSDAVMSVAWSPDGLVLASGSKDGSVKRWDIPSGRSVTLAEVHRGGCLAVAWSPDGKRLASAGEDDTIRFWDVATGNLAQVLRGHTAAVQALAWSPDGTRLASGSQDGTIRIWDTLRGQETLALRGHTANVTSVAWSPEGMRLASGSFDGTFHIWDATPGYASAEPIPSSESQLWTRQRAAQILRLQARHHRLHQREAQALDCLRRARTLYENELQRDPANLVAITLLADLLRTEWREPAWKVLRPTRNVTLGGATLVQERDGILRATGKLPDQDLYMIEGDLSGATALRLEVLPSLTLAGGGPGRSEGGNFHLTEVRVWQMGSAKGASNRPIALRRAWADFQQYECGIHQAIDGNLATPWGIFPGQGKPHQALFEFAAPVEAKGTSKQMVQLFFTDPVWKKHTLGRFRLATTTQVRPVRQIHLTRLIDNQISGLCLLGAVHALRGEWNEASAVLGKITQPGGVEWLLLAMVYGELGQTDQARRFEDLAFAWLLDHPASASVLELAIEAASQRLESRPTDWLLGLWRAGWQKQLGRTREANATLLSLLAEELNRQGAKTPRKKIKPQMNTDKKGS